MLIRTLKSYQPVVFIMFLAVSILAWVRPFINSKLSGIYMDPDPMPIYSWIFSLIGHPKFSFLCKLIAFTLVLLQGIVINGILNQYNLLGFRGYLSGIIYVLISSTFFQVQVLHPILFANLFLLFAWERVIRAYDKENTFTSYFNAAFLTGLASLFYPNSAYFLIIIIMSVGMNRVGHIREFAMVLLGFIIVWYFYLSLYFLSTNSLQTSGIEFGIGFSFPNYSKIKISQIIIIIYTGLLILFASFQLGLYMSNLKIPMRRNLKFMFLWFWISILMLVFTKTSIEIIYILAIPVSVLFAMFFFIFKKGWMIEVLWILFIICIIINQVFPNLLKI
jgi:hypothetical protein